MSYELNEYTAYWAGYLFADGSFEYNLTQGRNPIITLFSIDKEHIWKFINFVESGNRPYKAGGSDKQCWATSVSSRPLFDFLDEHGIISKIQVSDKLKCNRHFWRGFTDGDGYLAIKNDKRDNARAKGRIVLSNNSPVLLIQFKSFAAPILNNCNIRSVDKNCYQIGTTSYSGERLIEEIYKDSNIHLNRKKKIANQVSEIMGTERNSSEKFGGVKNSNSKLTPEEVWSIHLLYNNTDNTSYDLAEIFPVSPSSIQRIISGQSWEKIYNKYHE